jgi:hypothetical protein
LVYCGALRARLSEAWLLPLLGARVAREEPGLAQDRPQGRVALDERAGERVRDRAGLAGDAAAVALRQDREARAADGAERLGGDLLQRRAREVDLQRASVDGDLAVAGLQQDAGDRGLAAADGRDLVSRGHVVRS